MTLRFGNNLPSAIAVSAVFGSVIFVTFISLLDSRTGCERGCSQHDTSLQVDQEIASQVQTDRLGPYCERIFHDIVSGAILGKGTETYQREFANCRSLRGERVNENQTVLTYPLADSMPSEINNDGLIHGPMMSLVLCNHCGKITHAIIQDFAF